MGTVQQRKPVQPWRSRLFLPAYRVAEAARYAQTTPQTVGSWFSMASSLGPVLREKEKGQALSYLQLVEVAFIASFRQLGVSLQRIRRARAYAAQMFHAEFPFAELRFKTEGMHLLLELQQGEAEPAMARAIVADAHGQLAWESLVGDRFMQFDYEDGLAVTWHVRGRGVPVVIDPRVAFGAPLIRGVPTWVVKGRWEAGERFEEIEEDFGLDGDEVRQALTFEGIPVEQPAA